MVTRTREKALASLSIRLLGPFRVLVDEHTVEENRWLRRKPKLLVKLLALQPHHQLHREQVMELLWPDLDADAAANNLHKSIHAVRRALEPTLQSGAGSRFILTHEQQVVLTAPGKLLIDVEVFEQAAMLALKSADTQEGERALALYGGDLLIEDPYESWTTARRESLRALRQDLLVKLAQLYKKGGRLSESIARFKEIVALDPANEAAHRQLMRLYALTGSHQQALHQYERCCADLRRELDAQPEAATVALHQQIAAGQLQAPAFSEPSSRPTERQNIDSIAILPLANAGADPNVDYLSDGITESIINSFSSLGRLRVMARGTVFRYKGREPDPREVGRELKVRAVLTGRVFQIGDRLIVRVELVDAADGAHLWGEQYDRNLADILTVQKEIAREISEKLRLKLTSDEQKRLAKQHTVSTKAYHLYLKGRYFWYQRTEEALTKGIDFFQQAIKEDPGYAAAYDGLSDSYALLALRGILPHKDAFPRAKAMARKALEIDGSLAEAHASLAHVRLHDWDWDGLEEEFKVALELNPGHAMAYHWYSEYLRAMGRADDSIKMEKCAQEIDPLSPITSAAFASAYHFARRYDEAIEELRKALEINPNHFLLHLRLGISYLQSGTYQNAIAELQTALTLSGGSTEALAGLGQAYAVGEMTEEARRVLGQLTEQSKHRYISPYYVAKIYAALCDTEQALAWLQKGYEERNPDFIELKVEPTFDSLRSHPRFKDLVSRVGLTL